MMFRCCADTQRATDGYKLVAESDMSSGDEEDELFRIPPKSGAEKHVQFLPVSKHKKTETRRQ